MRVSEGGESGEEISAIKNHKNVNDKLRRELIANIELNIYQKITTDGDRVMPWAQCYFPITRRAAIKKDSGSGEEDQSAKVRNVKCVADIIKENVLLI